MRAPAAAVLCLLSAAACEAGDRPYGPYDGGPPDIPPIDMPVDAPPRCPLLARHTVATSTGQVVFLASRAGDPRLFFGERDTGRVRIIDATGAVMPVPFLDLGGMISTKFEQGLKGLAFAPDFATSGTVYVSYTTPAPDIHLVLARARLSADPNVLDRATLTTLLSYPSPAPNGFRVGGHIAFGPDGYLYMGVGDAEDPTASQDLARSGGKMIRIDPSVESPPLHYSVPADNPFLAMPAALPEIWAYGIREPWRWSFDSATGDLYLGEVGEGVWEEIDVQPHASHGGENYGWPILEGIAHCHMPPTGCTPPTGAVMPVYETMHDPVTAAILGGDVYHGTALPSCYQGRYFFGDYVGGWVRSFSWTEAGGVTDVQEHSELMDGSAASLDVDGTGEPYILALDGRIDRIVPAP